MTVNMDKTPVVPPVRPGGEPGRVADAGVVRRPAGDTSGIAVLVGLALQLVLAMIFIRVSLVNEAVLKLNDALLLLEQATQAGTGLVFGYLGGGPPPFPVSEPASTFVLAFRALPIVLVMSALRSLLFYRRVLPAPGFARRASR